MKIAVAPNGVAIIVNDQQKLRAIEPDRVRNMMGLAKDIAISPRGELFAVGGRERV